MQFKTGRKNAEAQRKQRDAEGMKFWTPHHPVNRFSEKISAVLSVSALVCSPLDYMNPDKCRTPRPVNVGS